MKKLLASILAGALLLTSMPAAFAADDLTGHWGKPYIEYLSELEVMRPSSDGSYKPDQKVTRAEFMRYINRAFHYTEKADISEYTDVSQYDANGNAIWYYEPVQIAVKQGYINGVSGGKMDPLGNVTREQAATILSRLHKTEPTASTSRVAFTDNSAIGNWSLAYIAEAIDNGYILGYSDGSFKPQGTITRAELAKLMYTFLGTTLDDANSSYSQSSMRSDTKNVTICEPCTLTGVTVEGNLYITEGLLSQAVTLQDVTVKGDLIISGGNVTLNGVTAANTYLSSSTNRLLEITATGETNIGLVEVQTDATLHETGLNTGAGGFSDLKVRGDNTPTLSLDAAIWDVTVTKPATITIANGASINTLIANAAATVTGYGEIQNAEINKNGCNLAITPKDVKFAAEISATINGVKQTTSGNQAVTPSAYSFDRSSSGSNKADFTLTAGTEGLSYITCDGERLTEDKEYTLTTSGFRLYGTYMKKLTVGKYSVRAYYESGTTATVALTIIDSSRNTINRSDYTFDRNQDSAEYTDIAVTLSLTKNAELKNVRISGTTYTAGDGYSYDASSGTVVLDRTKVAKKSTGTYTVTFTTTSGTSPTMSLIIIDSSPRNQLAETEVDFDYNEDSASYKDISIKLTCVDGAELDYITITNANNRKMEEDWQYRIDGENLVLNKNSLASLAKDYSYLDLYLSMDKGVCPTLRVNFIVTYAIRVKVADDLGEGLSSINITVAPTASGSKYTAKQTLTTNSDGIATAYVKKGEYTVTAEGEQISSEDAIIRTVNANSNQTINMTVEIKETLKIYVTDSITGRAIADADVTVGGQSLSTGADGTATFYIKRGEYSVRVSKSGYGGQSKNVTVNEATVERIKLEP